MNPGIYKHILPVPSSSLLPSSSPYENKVKGQKDRKTERQKDRKTERQKDIKTERQKDRKTERQKDYKLHNKHILPVS